MLFTISSEPSLQRVVSEAMKISEANFRAFQPEQRVVFEFIEGYEEDDGFDNVIVVSLSDMEGDTSYLVTKLEPDLWAVKLNKSIPWALGFFDTILPWKRDVHHILTGALYCIVAARISEIRDAQKKSLTKESC